MNARTLALTLFSLFALNLRAEECLTVQTQVQTKKPALPGMPGMDPSMLSPAMQKMIKEQSASGAPHTETTYWTPNMVVTVSRDQTSVMNFDTMTTTVFNHTQKSYFTTQLGKMVDAIGMAAPSANKRAAKKAPIKLGSNAPKATGQTQTVAGIPCTEYQSRIDSNGQEIMAEMMAKKGIKKSGPTIKTYTLETRCVNGTKPETYFRIRKSHEEKFLKSLPPATQEKIKAMASTAGEGGANSLVSGLISYQGQGAGSDFYKGFVLQSRLETKTEMPDADPRVKAQMEGVSSGATRLVTSIAASCPPAAVTKTPAGYKDMLSPTAKSR